MLKHVILQDLHYQPFYAPSFEMGEIGASVLHHMITGDDIHYPRRIQLPCQLKIRNSCK